MARNSTFKFDQLPLFTPQSDWQPPTELPDLSQYNEVSIDLETKDESLAAGYGPGFFKSAGYICGIGVAYGKESIYIPLRHPNTQCWDFDPVGRWLKQLASQNHTRFIFHNFSYDWGWLEAVFGIRPPALLDDTAAMASMINENLNSFTLDDLCRWQGLPGKDETLLKEAAYWNPRNATELKANLWRLPGKYVGPYGEQDATSTLALAEKLRPLIAEENLEGAYQTERDLMPLTLKMKQRGIRVDPDKAERLAKDIHNKCNEELIQVSSQLGHRITIKEIRSSRWLKTQFEDLGLHYPKTAPTDNYPEGQASFEKNFMAQHTHWFPRAVQRIKHQTDLAEKFLRGFICEYSNNNRIHATVNQFRSEGGGARSHRFSYSDPPLQQMPSRDDEYAPLIRSCFLAEAGELWCSIDYRQQEYRLIVFVAELLKARGARAAADMYRNDPNTDYHDYVAQITRLPRRRAKDVNFAKTYGAGIRKFAWMTGLSEEESATVMEQYDNELPFVREASERYSRYASQNGYIKLIDGARGHFNLWEPTYRDFSKEYEAKKNNHDVETMPCFEEEAMRRKNDPKHPWYGERFKRSYAHKAFNRMIQGSAARQIKKSMVLIYRAGYEPLIQLHDELGFSFIREEDGKACAEIMEQAVPVITIPMLTDTEWGKNWGYAKSTYAEAKKVQE